MISPELVFQVFIIACSSIAKAALVIAAGVLLTRRGAFTPEVRKGLSKAAASLLVPCLLMERLAKTVTPQLLALAWPVLPVGVVYVTLGCGLGALATARLPDHIRHPAIAASAFANSQALPVILIEVIGPELFGPDAAATGVTYIGLYLIVYLILQWTIGANLLDVPSLTLGGGERKSAGKALPSDSPEHVSSTPSTRTAAIELQGSSSVSSDAENGMAATAEEDHRDDHRGGGDGQRHGTAGLLVLGGGGGGPVVVSSCWRRAGAVLRRVASPPIYGICVGLCIGLLPPLRWAFLLDPLRSEHKPPLRFVMQAAGLLGSASIPLNTMLLGASLSKGPTWRVAPRRVVVGVVLTKLALLPVAALALCALLTRFVELPPLLLLVILMESAMPTANNLMMMCELAGGKSNQLMSTLIFAEYLASPLLLTASLTAFMAFVQAEQAASAAASTYGFSTDAAGNLSGAIQ